MVRVELSRAEQRAGAGARAHDHVGSLHLVPDGVGDTAGGGTDDPVVLSGQVLVDVLVCDVGIGAIVHEVDGYEIRRNRVDFLHPHLERLLEGLDDGR